MFNGQNGDGAAHRSTGPPHVTMAMWRLNRSYHISIPHHLLIHIGIFGTAYIRMPYYREGSIVHNRYHNSWSIWRELKSLVSVNRMVKRIHIQSHWHTHKHRHTQTHCTTYQLFTFHSKNNLNCGKSQCMDTCLCVCVRVCLWKAVANVWRK